MRIFYNLFLCKITEIIPFQWIHLKGFDHGVFKQFDLEPKKLAYDAISESM